MPRSRSRRSAGRPRGPASPRRRTPRWVAPVGLGLVLVGIAAAALPAIVALPGGGFNFLAGLALLVAGVWVLSRLR